jgi:hypothetical protein
MVLVFMVLFSINTTSSQARDRAPASVALSQASASVDQHRVSPSVDVPPQIQKLAEGPAPESRYKSLRSRFKNAICIVLVIIAIFFPLLAQIIAFILEMVFLASVKKTMNRLGPAIHTHVGLGSFVI